MDFRNLLNTLREAAAVHDAGGYDAIHVGDIIQDGLNYLEAIQQEDAHRTELISEVLAVFDDGTADLKPKHVEALNRLREAMKKG